MFLNAVLPTDLVDLHRNHLTKQMTGFRGFRSVLGHRAIEQDGAISSNIAEARWLVVAQGGSSIQWPFLAILVLAHRHFRQLWPLRAP